MGLAVCDALGAPVEFKHPTEFEPVTEPRAGGIHQLPAGHWTDDTSMALCLAESLIRREGFDAQDQMATYMRWCRDGHLSSTGRCFDIGRTTRKALESFEALGNPYSGETDERSAGNGSLMRLAPVPLLFFRHPALAIEYAGLSSRTTHGADEAVDACRFVAALIIEIMGGTPKAEQLAAALCRFQGDDASPLHPNVIAAVGSAPTMASVDLKPTGYVLDTLAVALWGYLGTEDFKGGALAAVNLGGDADTIGAVYGQIAGAFYGVSSIPEDWVQTLAMRDYIIDQADQLYELSSRVASEDLTPAAAGLMLDNGAVDQRPLLRRVSDWVRGR